MTLDAVDAVIFAQRWLNAYQTKHGIGDPKWLPTRWKPTGPGSERVACWMSGTNRVGRHSLSFFADGHGWVYIHLHDHEEDAMKTRNYHAMRDYARNVYSQFLLDLTLMFEEATGELSWR